ncbi:helicase-related protein [Butyrivibrio fibrisolvens]|uniref:helicase-related protein n=1 Tax=Butyrivibrio fibrisolvens TaxID=831 RepID=UPI0003B61F88|nr:SNF2-related protein [Butyrivibrio fibrisolvens]
MEKSQIIGKIHEYEFRLQEKMLAWLKKELPKMTDMWWDDIVYNHLSMLAKDKVDSKNSKDLEDLDLASLLKIVDENFLLFRSGFRINPKEREKIRDMREVRNDWAHPSPKYTKKKVEHDVFLIRDLIEVFGGNYKDTKGMEPFVFDVRDDKEILETETNTSTSNFIAPMADKPVPTSNDIIPGSIVSLVSDTSKTGAVVAVNNGTYTVWMDNAPQTFYREQIQLQKKESIVSSLALSRVRTALTAYQINNPSSSNLYSLNSARIDFVPYQFRPALKMIKADIPRLLVADDVGVGKTIEAGLILKEMEARASVNSVLIICPRPLVAERKWELEMKRFDENFTQLDGRELLECISETDRDGEWPERHRKTIIPYSLFGEDILSGTESKSNKKRKSKGLLQLDPVPHFDLVIVDEAHNIRNANTWAYQGVELFTRNADAVVFLTATPLQNSNKDLYTLLNLLRPDVVLDSDTFNTMSEPNVYINALLRTVRNQEEGWQDIAKEEISNILGTTWGRTVIQHNPNFAKVFELAEQPTMTREERIEAISLIESLHSFNSLITRTRRRDIEDFCIRHTQTINVPFSPKQHDIYDALMDFENKVYTKLHGGQSVRFLMCTIMRQAASCIYGLTPFVNDLVRKKLSQIQEDGEMFEAEIDLDSDLDNSIMELADELRSLTASLPDKDPKIEKLYEVIEQKQKEDNNRVILFSSFRHTLRYVREHLEKRGYRVAQVDGSVPDEERFRIRKQFLLDRDDENAIDILLFSEVGCEGLDYQFCDTMINYDLPWNPMRIEQRIGRIDRRGQKSEAVRIYNMITDDTIDAVIYNRCLSKIGVFEASIGDCSEILGDISEQIFKIMLDPGLTDEERGMKIEKLADNEVMKVKELNRLEQEQKALYGFDLTKYIQNKDVQDAENAWINADSISELVDTYLVDVLGDGEYIRGNKVNELKTMRISGEKKQILIDSMKSAVPVNNNNARKLWNAYLKSNSAQLKVTYDAATAKDNRDVTFLTQIHPLVLMAANHESRILPCNIGVSVYDKSIPSGDYTFRIYAWKYVGLKPDIKLVAVSDNEAVKDNILEYIQFAADYEVDFSGYDLKWDELDKLHYESWQKAKADYVQIVEDECNYRVEQQRQTTTKREIIIKGQIDSASDERIIRMRTSQLENLRKKYEEQKRELEDTIKRADIHTQPLIKGVLHVE